MAPKNDDGKPGPVSEDAKRREAKRLAEREARLAAALRSNLKRRKDQARGRLASSEGDGDAPGAERPETQDAGRTATKPPDGGL